MSAPVIKLQKFIKKNPSSLPSYSEMKEDSDDDDMESDDDEFVSKKDLEIGKLEDQIRYLKLDLNNEQLRVHELEEISLCMNTEVEIYMNNINFVKDFISLIIIKPFRTDINLANLLSYSNEMIDSTQQFEKVQTLYKHLTSYDPVSFPSTRDFKSVDSTYKKWLLFNSKRKCVDATIYNYHMPQIKEKFQEIKTSYEIMKNSLKSLNKKMEMMKMFIFVLCIVNFVLLMLRFI